MDLVAKYLGQWKWLFWFCVGMGYIASCGSCGAGIKPSERSPDKGTAGEGRVVSFAYLVEARLANSDVDQIDQQLCVFLETELRGLAWVDGTACLAQSTAAELWLFGRGEATGNQQRLTVLRAAVEKVQPGLPRGTRIETFDGRPWDYLVVLSMEGEDVAALYESQQDVISTLNRDPTIERVDLVSGVRPVLTVELDPDQLQRHQIDPLQVAPRLAAVDRRVDSMQRLEAMAFKSGTTRLADLANITFGWNDGSGSAARLGDAAAAVVGLTVKPEFKKASLEPMVENIRRRQPGRRTRLICLKQNSTASPVVGEVRLPDDPQGDLVARVMRTVPAMVSSIAGIVGDPLLIVGGLSQLGRSSPAIAADSTVTVLLETTSENQAGAIAEELNRRALMIPQTDMFFATGIIPPPIELTIFGEDWHTMEQTALLLEARLTQHDAVSRVRWGNRTASGRMKITFESKRLAAYGLTEAQLTQFLRLRDGVQLQSIAVGSRPLSQIQLRLGRPTTDLRQLMNLALQGSNGNWIPLMNVVRVAQQLKPTATYRVDGRRAMEMVIYPRTAEQRAALTAAVGKEIAAALADRTDQRSIEIEQRPLTAIGP